MARIRHGDARGLQWRRPPYHIHIRPTLAAGAPYALDDVATYNTHALGQAVNYHLLDDSTGHVYEVSATLIADGFNSRCDGVGAAIPAS